MTYRTAQSDVREKFDINLIDELLEHSGGALYALTVPLKNGRNILTHSNLSWNWSVLYDCKYNDTEKIWESHINLWKRGQEKAGLSTRQKKVSKKMWDDLEKKWKKEKANQRARSLRVEKKMAIERATAEELRKKLAEEEKIQRDLAMKRIMEEEPPKDVRTVKTRKRRTKAEVKAAKAAESTLDAFMEKPKRKPRKKKVVKKYKTAEFQALTKPQLIHIGSKQFKTKLDSRKKKDDLVKDLMKAQREFFKPKGKKK